MTYITITAASALLSDKIAGLVNAKNINAYAAANAAAISGLCYFLGVKSIESVRKYLATKTVADKFAHNAYAQNAIANAIKNRWAYSHEYACEYDLAEYSSAAVRA